MHVEEFLDTGHMAGLAVEPTKRSGSVDFSRAKDIEVSKEMYLEAESRGMSLSELLETPEYDLSEPGSALDGFERQLALAGEIQESRHFDAPPGLALASVIPEVGFVDEDNAFRRYRIQIGLNANPIRKVLLHPGRSTNHIWSQLISEDLQ